jgi:hypothetical protein
MFATAYPRSRDCTPRVKIACPGYHRAMFIFFSNRLGCAGSLLVSAAVTLVLLLVLGVIRLGS